MKKIVISISIIVIIAVVFLAPIPQRINISSMGVDKQIPNATLHIEVDGFYLKYLVRSDRFRGKITIAPYAQDNASTAEFKESNALMYLLPREHGNIYFTSVMRYNEKMNRFTNATVFFDEKFERVLIDDYAEDKIEYISYSDQYSIAVNDKYFETR